MELDRRSCKLMSMALLVIMPCLQTTLAQEKKRLAPKSAMTDYTFRLAAGMEVHVHVQLDDTSTITGASISRGTERVPFQTVSTCKPDCGFTSFCSKLINGKWRGIDRPTACGDGPIEEVTCPASAPAARKPPPRAKQQPR